MAQSFVNSKFNEIKTEGISPWLPFYPLRNAVFSLRQSILTSQSQDASSLLRETLARFYVYFNQKLTHWWEIWVQSPRHTNERPNYQPPSWTLHFANHGEDSGLHNRQRRSRQTQTFKQATSPQAGWGELEKEWWKERDIMNKTLKYYSKPWIRNSGPAHHIQARSVKFT